MYGRTCLALTLTFAAAGCGQLGTTSAPQPQFPSPGAASPTPTPRSDVQQVVLHADGIGNVWFGLADEGARQALIELWGEPDREDVESCEFGVSESESRDRTWIWGDLEVSVRAGGADGSDEVYLAGWSVNGPDTPPGVIPPFDVVPGIDSKVTLLRSVQGIREDEVLTDLLGAGYYARGKLGWFVEEVGGVTNAYVHLAICE